jgi:hypothetical protein
MWFRCRPKTHISSFKSGLRNMGMMKGDDSELIRRLNLFRSVYSVMLGTKPHIILSSDVAIKDLLDKRGNIYSDRPDLYISQRVASGGHRLVVMVSILQTFHVPNVEHFLEGAL